MSAASTVVSLAVFALLLLPPGYAALRMAGSRAGGVAGLAAAFGLGWSLSLPLLLAEIAVGGRFFNWVLAAACLAWLRPGREAWRGARALLPDLTLPLALGVLFCAANASDYRRGPEGASFRLGFDVADRVGYGVVAAEVLRAPPGQLENPLFAPLPIQYSLFPALAGLLLRRCAGAAALPVFVWQLPVIGIVFVGVTVAGLLAEWGASRAARIVTTALVALGGDLSFLTRTVDRTGLERAAHFFAFHSFSAEALLYNSWIWALPLALSALVIAGRWLDDGRRQDLVLLALVLGALWQTKVFAFLVLLAGAAVAAVVRRRARLFAVVAAGVAGGAPWILLTALSAGARSGWPLLFDPLRAVRLSLDVNETLRSAAGLLGGSRAAVSILGTALFLVGGFGLRLVGVRRLARAVRSDPTGLHALVAGALGTAVAASLLLRGNPMPVDGVQFLLFAQYLSWLYAGPALASLLPHRAWAGLPLIALAVVAPVTSLARKMAPERFTTAEALDRVHVTLRPETLRACEFLRTGSAPGDRLVLPLAGDPEDAFGMKPLLVAALAERRVVAYTVAVHLSFERVEERRGWATRLYETADPAEAQALLDRLGAQWIWDDDARPLRVRLPGWRSHDVAPGIRLLSREGGPVPSNEGPGGA